MSSDLPERSCIVWVGVIYKESYEEASDAHIGHIQKASAFHDTMSGQIIAGTWHDLGPQMVV